MKHQGQGVVDEIVLEDDVSEAGADVIESAAAAERADGGDSAAEMVVGCVEVVALVDVDRAAVGVVIEGVDGVGEIVVGDEQAIGSPGADIVPVDDVLDGVAEDRDVLAL
jgi:hypothetical protein